MNKGRQSTITIELPLWQMLDALPVLSRILSQPGGGTPGAGATVRTIYDLSRMRRAIVERVGTESPVDITRQHLLKVYGKLNDKGQWDFDDAEKQRTCAAEYQRVIEECEAITVPPVAYDDVAALPVQPALVWAELMALVPLLQDAPVDTEDSGNSGGG